MFSQWIVTWREDVKCIFPLLTVANILLQLKGNIEKFFTWFVEEGKATVRLKEPAVDICLSKVWHPTWSHFISLSFSSFFFFLSEIRKQQDRVLSMFTPHVERTTVSPHSLSHTGCFVCSIYITAASLFPLSLSSASACLVAVVSFHTHTVQPGSQSKTLTPTDWLSPRDSGEQGKQVLLTKAFSKQEGKKVPRGIRRSFPGTSHDGGFK